MKLNINADMGESFGPYVMGDDAGLMSVIASANVACGFHAGDPVVLTKTVEMAKANGVSVGAHPGYADIQGFGRRQMTLSERELRAMTLYQLGALAGVARGVGCAVTHVKPHGALNNQACVDRGMSDVIAQAIRDFDPGLILLAPVTSQLAAAGVAAGLPVALEVFADRTYEADGQLTPRSIAGSVLHDGDQAIAHVRRMIEVGGVTARDGSVLKTPFHSICVHGDGPGAIAIAGGLRKALEADGHQIATLPEMGLGA